jgi:hypothetical protein
VEALGRGDQTAVVIGHIDNRRHAAGGSAASRPYKVLLALLTAAVHLGVNRARKNKKPVAAVAFARWRRARSDGLHQPVADENVAAVNNSIGKDDRTDKDLICHTLLFAASVARNIGAAEPSRLAPTCRNRPLER